MRQCHDCLIDVTGITHEQISSDVQGLSVKFAVEVSAHVKPSRDLRAGQINVLQSGRTHEQITIDLQEEGIQGAIELGADETDLSRDFRAGQDYVLEIGLVPAD